MIFFFENGRLGNQLIQYIGLKSFFSKERIIFIGCKSLFNTFNNVDAVNLSKEKINKWVHYGLLKKVISLLVKIRIFGKITEDRQSNSYKVISKKGLFWKIFVVENFFFRIKDVKNYTNTPTIKPHLTHQAEKWLKIKGINIKTHSVVFVHFRRGDYLYWPSKEFPAVLSLDWYKKAMSLIKEKIQNPIFILISDDKYYLKDFFKESETLHISENDPEVDFSIMSLCNYGILSASTFGWCSAYYANLGKKNKTFFIAPKYWEHHRSKKITKNYITDFIHYI
jgi:hypothetical protein